MAFKFALSMKPFFKTQSELYSSALARITVSKVFYNKANMAFPRIFENKGYATLFLYLLFGGWHDRKTHQLLLSSSLLSEFEGRSPSNTQAEMFLCRFSDALPRDCQFKWSGFNYKTASCRQLREFYLGAFEEVVASERAKEWHNQGRVYLDGSAYSTAKQRAIRLSEQKAAFEDTCQCAEQQFINNYLNALPSNLFSTIVTKNIICARNIALGLDNPIVVEAQERQLRSIDSQPQPFYFCSDRTVRLFTRDSIATLQKDVRKALTRDWSEADLRHSQLAICARLWNIVEVEDFLRSGGNFWATLMEDIGVVKADADKIKPILKKRLYSTCYGMELGSVKGLGAYALVCGGFDKKIIYRFLEHPLIEAVFRTREIELLRIAKVGGGFDAYNQWISVEGDRQPRDIMASVAQSWEMKLIFPAFLLASQTRDFTITLFQHDGFSVNFRRRKDLWKKRIENVINERIGKYNILTGIEWND